MEGQVAREIKEEYLRSIDVREIQVRAEGIDQNTDKLQYLSMRVCAGCNTNFSNLTCKKYFCQFCYKAFCNKCSVLSLFHPETNRNERCCNPCYLLFTQKSVFSLVEKFAETKMQTEIQERAEEEKKQKNLNEEILSVKAEIELEKLKFSSESEKISSEVLKMEEKIREKMISLIQIKRKISEKEEEIQNYTKNDAVDYINKKAEECSIY